MRIAYLISAYHLPEMLVRLVRRLDAMDAAFFIHVDARTDQAVYRAMAEPLADRGNVHFLARHPCHWGDFGHVRATLKGLEAVIRFGRPFDYVALLTGQDYPVRSNQGIAERLTAARGAIFMRASPLPNPRWSDGGLDRIQHWHFRIGERALSFPGTPFRHPTLDRAWSFPARLLRLRRRLPHGLRPYGGGSYWWMPEDCARFVDSFAREHPRFTAFFRHVHVPDEIFFQTIVMNSMLRDRVVDDDLRYQKWDANADNPAVLTSADLDAIVRSGYLFARKFDPRVDSAVLDALDRIRARVT